MAEIKRAVARHIRISTLRNGEYVKQGGWDPNFVKISSGEQVSRANVMGVVITEPTDLELQIDDGSGKMTLRQFEATLPLTRLRIGDPVLVIGRPREYEREIYLLPYILKKIDPVWIKVRMQQVPAEESAQKQAQPVNEDLPKPQQEAARFRESYERIYSLIRQLDDGKGADVEEVLQTSQIKEGEEIIKQLILEGEVFELFPGRLKVLQ